MNVTRLLTNLLRCGSVVQCTRQLTTAVHKWTTPRLLTPTSTSLSQFRSYMPRNVLELRCPGCFFEKRKGRLYVECTLKPRHRQMKRIMAKNLYRDDYSKGKVTEACWWKYRTDRYYKQGKTEFTNFNWLGDRLGKDV